MSKLFVVCERGFDSSPAHGVYTGLQRALCVAIHVEEAYATDYGLSIQVFNVDQEIELETLTDDNDSNTSIKYIDTTVIDVERLDTGDDTVRIQVELSNEHIAALDIDMVELINSVCSECEFKISDINTTMVDSMIFELTKG